MNKADVDLLNRARVQEIVSADNIDKGDEQEK